MSLYYCTCVHSETEEEEEGVSGAVVRARRRRWQLVNPRCLLSLRQPILPISALRPAASRRYLSLIIARVVR